MRIAALGFVFACLIASAHADPLEGYDDAALAACVEQADGARDALRACVGAAAWPCVEAGQGATQARALCWAGEHAWWMRRAAEASAELEALDPERAAALSAAGEAFQSFVEQECAYRGATFQGGSGAQPAMAQCAAELWAERFIMLGETQRGY